MPPDATESAAKYARAVSALTRRLPDPFQKVFHVEQGINRIMRRNKMKNIRGGRKSSCSSKGPFSNSKIGPANCTKEHKSRTTTTPLNAPNKPPNRLLAKCNRGRRQTALTAEAVIRTNICSRTNTIASGDYTQKIVFRWRRTARL